MIRNYSYIICKYCHNRHVLPHEFLLTVLSHYHLSIDRRTTFIAMLVTNRVRVVTWAVYAGATERLPVGIVIAITVTGCVVQSAGMPSAFAWSRPVPRRTICCRCQIESSCGQGWLQTLDLRPLVVDLMKKDNMHILVVPDSFGGINTSNYECIGCP